MIVTFIFCLILFSCSKTVGYPKKDTPLVTQVTNTGVTKPCEVAPKAIISYSNTVSKIIRDNCLPCHSAPGSGGINLDSYTHTKSLALGELMNVVICTPGNIQMPPPPKKLLDSCQIKVLNLWIKQGCLFN